MKSAASFAALLVIACPAAMAGGPTGNWSCLDPAGTPMMSATAGFCAVACIW